jgi:hypothetical protein
MKNKALGEFLRWKRWLHARLSRSLVSVICCLMFDYPLHNSASIYFNGLLVALPKEQLHDLYAPAARS